MTECGLDNALIHQKDAIIDLIDNGQYAEAIPLLKFVKELWEECSYGYKWRELQQRGITATDNNGKCGHWKQIQALREWQDKFRTL